ncbi:unnamed protein product [Hydatigera taeniaeformis]|uniref:DRBM domain-containing protein n=1 Tax=Hydatigena taeniaeformis TaxID=6205 RepID=A0A3P7FUN3_HYDTA|nr:unnamed protein product [Hydatigera taeniaeformis]
MPMDPVRLMHELYPDLEISEVECLSKNSASDNSNVASSGKREDVQVAGQRVRVMAKYKGRWLSGEGINVRTAKLKIAEQLGIGFS